MTRTTADARQADVIVVGAGPAGASAAYHLAEAGVDVLLLEKSAFPRDKICGDGLTPRAVRQLIAMGIDLDAPGLAAQPGPAHRRCRPPARAAVARAGQLPRLRHGPHPLRPRRDPGPARREGRRAAHGAHRGHRPRLRRAHRPGRSGVTAQPVDERGRRVEEAETYTAPVVIACDGVSARLATALGLERREDRPMGVAVRAYYRTPAPRRRVDGVVARAVGRRAEPQQPAPRLRLDLRRRRRHRQRRSGHPQHLEGLPARRLQGRAAPLARPHPRGVGLPRREPRRPHRLGRAADGLQPQAALHPRRAARR